jgi:hypothetical protein
MRWPIALALFLSAANALAQGSYQHPETRFVFPAVIGAFERQSAEHYPDARLGVKVGYVARGLGRADIYLYDLGIVGIPDGIDSKAVRDAFASAAADVEEMGRRGYYLDLRRISKPGATLEISGRTPRFLLAGYEYRIRHGDREEPVVSLLIVTGARASFLKVRYTYLASRADGRSELEKLLIDFFAANKSAPGANL